MVVPYTLLRHLNGHYVHTQVAQTIHYIYESGRDAIGIDLEWNLDGIDLDTIELELI